MSNNNIDRRNFLKVLSTGTAAASTGLLYGCGGDPKRQGVSQTGSYLGEVPTDKMTYRTNPHTGDKVSLLGYGCMRWPLRQKADGSGEEIDQEAVNALVDYAIAHGVNYFDVAPVYVRGLSEQATGLALSRHSRDKYFIATKLSTHRPVPEWRTLEGSKGLFEQSLKNLRVDYIDYYLIHGVGLGGMDDLRKRLYDNGVLDFVKGAESRSYPQFGLVVSWRRQGLRLFVILGYPLGLRSDPVELRGLEKCFWLERECGVFVWGIGEA